MSAPAHGNKKSAAQVIEELRAEVANAERREAVWRDAAVRNQKHAEHLSAVIFQKNCEVEPMVSALAEARDLLRQWLAGKEPGLATSRWLAKVGE